MEMTPEQKIIKKLAEQGILTKTYDIHAALLDPEVAKKILTGDGVMDEVGEAAGAECDHKALTNDEIQEVFDNDNE